MVERILRLPQVKAATGLSRSSIYSSIARGDFPAQVSIGPRCVGWSQGAVQRWVDARIKAGAE